MEKNLKSRIIILLLISILFFVYITGCSKIFQNSKGESNQESQDQKKDPPKILTSMEEDTEKIIEEIQKIKDQEADMVRQQQIQKKEGEKEEKEQSQKGEEQESQGQGQKQGKNKQQGEDESDGGQQKQGQEQKQGEEQKDQQTPKVDWSSIEKTIENLHSNWNTYEIQARKDGASQDLLENYELQLDTLTNWIMSHSEAETLKAANTLYQYYPRFLNLYKHQAPPDVKEIVYYVRQIIIDAQENNWEEIDERLEAITKAWQTAKVRMEKPDQELNQKVEAAIEDFSRVAKQQNYLLTKLKGNILLKNLQEIK